MIGLVNCENTLVRLLLLFIVLFEDLRIYEVCLCLDLSRLRLRPFSPPMEPLRILLIGNGGREHALACKLSQSARVEVIYVAPGNGGTASGHLRNVENVSHLMPDDFDGLIAFAKDKQVNLIVPGPEAPLVAGIGSACRAGESPERAMNSCPAFGSIGHSYISCGPLVTHPL